MSAGFATVSPGCTVFRGEQQMYGLIGKMTAVSGQRDALIGILLDGMAGMPGCLSYVVARDPADTNAIWITEVWDSEPAFDAKRTVLES
jgi:quinol monooxygenase YgiN